MIVVVVGFAVAAGVGAVVRHVARVRLTSLRPIPLGTLVVNLTGSFLLGLIAGWNGAWSTVIGTAGLGALTTFSTFSEEIVELRAVGGRWIAAYAVTSVVGGVALAWIGLQLG
jgi:fluoride exporter